MFFTLKYMRKIVNISAFNLEYPRDIDSRKNDKERENPENRIVSPPIIYIVTHCKVAK